MSLKHFPALFASLLLTVLLFSCGSEPGNTAELITGRWNIDQAYRDGQQTGTLDELFFVFNEDGTMRTNLSGAEEEAAYEVDGNVIRQRDSRIEADYEVLEITDSTLVLTTELRNFRFRFDLKKQ